MMHRRSYYTKWLLLMLSIICAVSACDYLQKPFPTSTPDVTLLPGVTATGFEGAPRNLDWSPDDQQLLITGWYAGEEQIVVLDVTTGAIEKLVALPGEMQQNGWLDHARWSVDGRYIIFSKNGRTIDKEIPISGIWIQEIKNKDRRYFMEIGSFAEWDVTGDFVFVATCGYDTISSAGWSFCKVRTDSGQTVLTFGIEPDTGEIRPGRTMELSPDGRFLATYAALEYDQTPQYHIYILDIANQAANKIDTISGSQPTWSPQGNLLAFRGQPKRNASEGLYVMHQDGTCPTLILPIPVSFPAWSHNGKQIAFVYENAVYILDITIAVDEDIAYGHLPCP